MQDLEENIIRKDSFNLSRNSPASLVVGAGGFLGSHLVDELLLKNIQVIGVDDFSTGKRENLTDANKNKRFHLRDESAERLELEPPRLDYIFIVAEGNWRLKKILDLAKNYQSKIVFVSTIELYDRNYEHNLSWFKEAESEVARFASENNLNARVIRLAPIFGPRMHFRAQDPMVRLIQSSILGELQKETTSMDFSTRALYIKDSVNLIIKSMFIGSTASKIFDGVSDPVKVAEVKQILLDPLWHEARRFQPSELPPWSTPNLEKTKRLLNWKPQVSLVSALAKTLDFFRENPAPVSRVEAKINQIDKVSDEWRRNLEVLKGEVKPSREKPQKKQSLKIKRGLILALLGWGVIIYALIYPLFSLIYGSLTYRFYLSQSSKNLQAGEFDQALSNINTASSGIDRVDQLISSLEFIKKMGLFRVKFNQVDGLIGIGRNVAGASTHAALGAKNLYGAGQVISGESHKGEDYLSSAEAEFAAADQLFAKAKAEANDFNRDSLPAILTSRVDDVGQKVDYYSELSRYALLLTQVLKNALVGQKSYLIILGQNGELRAGGGLVQSVARIDFEGGKFKRIEISSVADLDKRPSLKIDPPKEIKEDLGKESLGLQDANFEADFPTNAREIEWIYSKITGVNVDGVIFFDTTATANLLAELGPLNIEGRQINKDNLRDADEDMLTAINKTILNRIIFVPKDYLKFLSALIKSVREKHLMVYTNDTELFSRLNSQNLTNFLPRVEGKSSDFLFPVESNYGQNRANFYLDRRYNLETKISKEGAISHTLRISYTNKSLSLAWPEGVYKNRMKLFLPLGSKITKLSLAEADLKSEISSLVDYGRQTFSFKFNLEPQQQKTLLIVYEVPLKINMKEKENYKLDVIKQPGLNKDPFEWKLTGIKETKLSTDLSEDRSFEVSF